jgi:ketosteroid isomerase-like protein
MRQTLRAALIAGAIGSLALAGCQKPTADAAAIRKELRAEEDALNAAYKDRDLARISIHYAPDATLMAPGSPAVKGAEAIHDQLKALVADPALEFRFAADKVGVSQSGDLAYARGPFSLTLTDPQTKAPVTLHGAYISVYRKQSDGQWKALETIVSPGQAAPIPPH